MSTQKAGETKESLQFDEEAKLAMGKAFQKLGRSDDSGEEDGEDNETTDEQRNLGEQLAQFLNEYAQKELKKQPGKTMKDVLDDLTWQPKNSGK